MKSSETKSTERPVEQTISLLLYWNTCRVLWVTVSLHSSRDLVFSDCLSWYYCLYTSLEQLIKKEISRLKYRLNPCSFRHSFSENSWLVSCFDACCVTLLFSFLPRILLSFFMSLLYCPCFSVSHFSFDLFLGMCIYLSNHPMTKNHSRFLLWFVRLVFHCCFTEN